MKPTVLTQTRLLLTSALLMTLGALSAQSQESTLVTGGTTYDSPNGGRWAYLFWRTEDPTAFLSTGTFGTSTFVIYAKSGAPNSVAPYAKVTDVSLQNTTSTAVAALLARSVNLGQNLTLLNARIDEIFAPLLPLQGGGAAADFLLADKVGVLLAAASNNEEVAQNLFLLARSHPGIDLVRGGGVALPIAAALTTYEVRLVNAAGEEVAVVGRVTLNGAAAAPRLPAPGRPISVPVVAEKKLTGLGDIPAAALDAERQAILNRTLDRVARLRWATPDNLRRLSVLQHGFNVYRVQRAYAETNGWNLNPPTPAVLRDLADKATVPQVNRANTESPVIPEEEFNDNQVIDFESNSEAFFVDDQRTLPGVEKAYVHGSQYYYFVAARDVLGRDGLVSQGTLVTMLNRLPPAPAQGVRTTNEYAWNADDNRSTQLLRVRWEPGPPYIPGVNDGGELRYHVFRWPTADAYQKYLSQLNVEFFDGEGRRFGRITGEDGLSFAPGVQPSFLDNTPDAPNETTPRRTYWYTVVITEKVELDPLEGSDPYFNISGHSAPGSGIIRKWDGPAAPEVDLYVDCYKPGITLGSTAIYTVPDAEQTEGFVQLRLECEREAPVGIHWVEFIFSSGESLGRIYFENGAVNLQRTFSLEESELLDLLDEAAQGKPFLQVIAGSDLGDGAVSNPLTVNAATVTGTLNSYKDPEKGIKLSFEAKLTGNRTLVSQVCTGGVILPENPITGEVPKVEGFSTLDATTPEWRVYRRVDDGELIQVASGFHKNTDPAPVVWTALAQDAQGQPIDDPEDYIGPPPNGGRICYYTQTFDVDGNGGPFSTICINSLPLGVATGQAQEHRPVISEITSLGNGTEQDSAKLRIRWSAATGATKRFHLLINDGTATPQEIYSVDGLGANLVPAGVSDGSQRGRAGVYPIVRYSARAPKPGGDFHEDIFQIDLPARSGRNYRVSIQAVALSRSTDRSNRVRDWGVIATSDPVDVVWTNPTLPSTQQPDAMAWPQRLADTGTLNPQVWSKFLGGSIQGVGIRVGQMTVDSFGTFSDGKPGYTVPMPFVAGHVASKAFLFQNLEVRERFQFRTRPVMPFTLYRYRVPEGAEENPDLTKSSDIVQVSPLIEEVGYEHTVNAQAEPITLIRDPFIRLVPADDNKLDIYVLDTHPVIRGERYRYVLVRFNEAHEIDKAYPVRAVDANNASINAVVIPEL